MALVFEVWHNLLTMILLFPDDLVMPERKFWYAVRKLAYQTNCMETKILISNSHIFCGVKQKKYITKAKIGGIIQEA